MQISVSIVLFWGNERASNITRHLPSYRDWESSGVVRGAGNSLQDQVGEFIKIHSADMNTEKHPADDQVHLRF